MREIKLTQGKVAIVDDEDYEYLNKIKWYYREGRKGRGYVLNSGSKVNKTVRMHRLVNKTPEGLVTDHINGNTLDNRKCNLRTCTTSQNLANKDKPKNNTSGYKGVSWCKRSKAWLVSVRVDSKNKHVGYYKDVIEAARAYNKAALKYHGDFARLNEI